MDFCSFSSCHDSEITDQQDYCEIKTVFPNKKKAVHLKSKFAVKWKSNGEAKLHVQCWDQIIKASRKRSKTKNKTDLQIVEEEKCLIKEAAKTVEYFDSREKIRTVAVHVANLIKKSKHFVCFTGAGISTSAGIGDYRGKSGKWTQQDQSHIITDTVIDSPTTSDSDASPTKKLKLSDDEGEDDDDDDDDDDDEGVNYEDLRPTYTHEALHKLMEDDHLKYIISQNGDGLHTLSQIPPDKISELHGNVFIEKCENCSERYERGYYVMDDECSQYFEDLEEFNRTDIKKPKHAKKCSLCGLSHRTGRKCEKKGCNGHLIDTIINFKDNLEDVIYERAVDNAQTSDLMLCLGTTLLVTPANELVEMTKDPQTIVICNRQKTPLDYLYKKAGCQGYRVYGDCDVFMKEIMTSILSSDEKLRWESRRTERLVYYDKLRGK